MNPALPRLFFLYATGMIFWRAAAPANAAEVKAVANPVSAQKLVAFRARLLAALAKHLDILLDAGGKVAALTGKSAEESNAHAYYLAYQVNRNPRYHAAALQLADRVLHAMRATPHGVLEIKENEKASGETISSGGPPPFAWYASQVAYILHQEGQREEDLRYVAEVVDEFAWNADGWWSNDVDIKTGKSKSPQNKAGAINKKRHDGDGCRDVECVCRPDRSRAIARDCELSRKNASTSGSFPRSSPTVSGITALPAMIPIARTFSAISC